MTTTERGAGEPRELRLEGLGLVLVGGVLLALVAGAFVLGRWVERRSQPPLAATSGAPTDALGQVARSEPDADLSGSVNRFDRVERGEVEAEPGREARPSPAPPPAPEPAAPAVDRQAPYWVQVSAGRDREAADLLVERLRQAGFRVRLFAEREGAGELVKVRVGGYATQDEARLAAQQLQRQGHAGAWVTEVR